MLAPLFGTRADRFTRFLSPHQLQISATAAAFSDAWQSMQQEVAGQGVSDPLDQPAAQAGEGRAASAGLQRLITTQREQVARGALHRDIMQLPHGDTRREAWLACDAFSSAWIGSWPAPQDALSPQEFPEVLATYLGRESPAVRALAGQRIPCCRQAGPRVSDPFGQQLGLAQLTDRAHGECHDYIAAGMFRDCLHAGLRGETECRALFGAVLPAAVIVAVDGERGLG